MFLIVTGVLLLQFGLVSISFPITELFTANPLFHIDMPFHWYQMKTAVNLAQMGNVVGYDPFFGAGYIGGVTYSLSTRLPAALAVIFNGWADEIKIYKISSFVFAVVAPASIPLALRLLKLNLTEVLVGSALGIMLWWTSIFRWFYTAGMTAFVLGSYLTILYLAIMFLCWSRSDRWSWRVILALLGALGMFIHPLFPLPIAIASLIYLVIQRRVLSAGKSLVVLVWIPLVILAFNLIWLVPFYYYNNRAPELSVAQFQKIVDVNLIWQELMGLWKGDAHGSKLYAPLLVGALWGCWGARSGEQRRLAHVLSASGVILILFAAVGASIPPLRNLEPNRFFPVGYLFLTVAAAAGIPAMVRSGVRVGGGWTRLGALCCLGLTFPALLWAANEVRREVSYADVGHYGAPPPEVKGLGDYSRWLLGWSRQRTTANARILFETSLARIHDGGHMAGYYAYETGREFIGGPYPFMNFAGFVDGRLFGKLITEISPQEFLKYADLYNIGWIVVHSEASKRYLKNVPGVVPLEGYKQLQAYKIERRPSYFITGTGEVLERGHNKLVLSELSGDRVILKYHYFSGLVSAPAAQIAPVKMDGDPGPFIMILNPPKRLRLFIP